MSGRTVSRTMSMRPSESTVMSRATLGEMMTPEFYTREFWVDELFEGLFKIRDRETTIRAEVYFGFVHFISCFYCLAVIPRQMSFAGYSQSSMFVATAACSGVGSIICGLFANLPFVIAPPTVVTIFLSVFLQNSQSKIESAVTVGSIGVIFSGILLMLMGWRPLGQFVGRLIPYSIQAGTAVGIGLLTALAGAVDIKLVVTGENNELLQLGVISDEVIISVAGVIIICLASHFHIKGAFCIAIIICSIIWGIISSDWPTGVVSMPVTTYFEFKEFNSPVVPILVIDLLFLYILYLNGLIASLSNLANLTREDGQTPRGRWIFILSGIMTIASGLLTGAPVLISPESAAAIKEGAKTGLSTLVCGSLFLLSILFSPIFEAIPAAGTSPILLMIGVLLFQNVGRVDWRSVKDATPAFIVLFFIPFSYSVIQGVLLGYSIYLIVGFFTGDLQDNLLIMLHIYLPDRFQKHLSPDPRRRSSAHSDADKVCLWSDQGSIEGNFLPNQLDAPIYSNSPRSSMDSKNGGSHHSQRDLVRDSGRSISVETNDVYMSMGFEHDQLFSLKQEPKISNLSDTDNPVHPHQQTLSRQRSPTTGAMPYTVHQFQSNNISPQKAVRKERSNSNPSLPSIREDFVPHPILKSSSTASSATDNTNNGNNNNNNNNTKNSSHSSAGSPTTTSSLSAYHPPTISEINSPLDHNSLSSNNNNNVSNRNTEESKHFEPDSL